MQVGGLGWCGVCFRISLIYCPFTHLFISLLPHYYYPFTPISSLLLSSYHYPHYFLIITPGGVSIALSIFQELSKRQGVKDFLYLLAAADHAVLLQVVMGV